MDDIDAAQQAVLQCDSLKRDKRTFILRRKTAHQKAEEAAQQTGVPAHSVSGLSADRFDYEKKYPADEPEKGFESDSRVWRVYLDEAGQFDLDMVENIRDTVDVILVFAGLFSAIVSTLVSQTSTSLQLDYAQVTAALLMELIAVQRAIGTTSSTAHIPPSLLDINSPQTATSSTSSRWVNGLWFTSLAFSLTTALVAVLVKQWLQAYVAPIFQGTPKDHGRIRHFRYLGMEEWHVPLIVGLLPTCLHLSLFLFFVGLVVFMFTLNFVIGSIVGCVASAASLIYIITNILPLWNHQCPYKTPISNYAPKLAYFVMSFFPTRYFGPTRWWETCQTLKEMESGVVDDQGEELSFQMFGWLCKTSSNPSVQSVVLQAVGDLPLQHSGNPVLRDSLLDHVCANVRSLAQDKSLHASAVKSLAILLEAHLHLTPIQTRSLDFDVQSCYCVRHAYDLTWEMGDYPHQHQLRFVYLSPFHLHQPLESGFLGQPSIPTLHDLVHFQPPFSSRREWITLLQRAILAKDSLSRVVVEPAAWLRLIPLLNLLDQRFTHEEFFVRQGVLLAAYLAHCTRPSWEAVVDEHELLELALYHNNPGQVRRLMHEPIYREVLAHYLWIVCEHALDGVEPANSTEADTQAVVDALDRLVPLLFVFQLETTSELYRFASLPVLRLVVPSPRIIQAIISASHHSFHSPVELLRVMSAILHLLLKLQYRSTFEGPARDPFKETSLIQSLHLIYDGLTTAAEYTTHTREAVLELQSIADLHLSRVLQGYKFAPWLWGTHLARLPSQIRLFSLLSISSASFKDPDCTSVDLSPRLHYLLDRHPSLACWDDLLETDLQASLRTHHEKLLASIFIENLRAARMAILAKLPVP